MEDEVQLDFRLVSMNEGSDIFPNHWDRFSIDDICINCTKKII